MSSLPDRVLPSIPSRSIPLAILVILILLLLSCHSPPAAARITITITPVDIDMIIGLILASSHDIPSAVHSMYDSRWIPVCVWLSHTDSNQPSAWTFNRKPSYMRLAILFTASASMFGEPSTKYFSPDNLVGLETPAALLALLSSYSLLPTSTGLALPRWIGIITRQIRLYRPFCSAPIQ